MIHRPLRHYLFRKLVPRRFRRWWLEPLRLWPITGPYGNTYSRSYYGSGYYGGGFRGGYVSGRMAQPMLEELVLKLLGNIAQKLRVTRWPSR
jgi:hypothetical protein